MCVYIYVNMNAGFCRGQKRMQNFSEGGITGGSESSDMDTEN